MVDNVLVVVLDALRADRVGCYGDRDLTPNIDELASDGIVFERAYSTTTATDPAITSLHTGRYPLSHGIVHHGTHVTDEEKAAVESTPLLPQVLADHGYRTVAAGRPLGRWHKRGFDEYPDVSTAQWRLKAFEKAASRILYDVHPAIGDTVSGVYNRLAGPKGGSSDDVDETVEEVVATLDTDRPTYGFVHWMDTHTPYSGPEPLVEECLDRYDETEARTLESVASDYPEGSITANSLRPGGVVYEGSEPWIEDGYEPDTRLIRARYDAAVRHADRKVGALASALRDRDLYEDTMLVVLADHGESLGEHGIYYEHHGLYECTVRIPLIVRVPGADSTRVEDLVSITDLAPTIYDYADVDEPPSTDGRSLRGPIDGTSTLDRTALLAEEANAQRRRMILSDGWKYVEALDEGTCRYCERRHAPDRELYDLEADPGEQRNRAEEFPDRAAELADAMEERADALSTKRGDADRSVTYDDEAEMMERLESLGYR